MSRLVQQASRLLREMFDETQALFSYSLREVDGRYVNDFSHPSKIRYTINVLAGLQAAADAEGLDWDVAHLVDRFASLHLPAVVNAADKGLMLHVLASAGHERRDAVLSEIETLLDSREATARLNLQEIGWLLSGLCRHAEITGDGRSVASAERLFRATDRDYLNRDTLLPRFTRQWWRRPFTSFGGLTYFLMALRDYAAAFNDPYAEMLFRESVVKTIQLQGRGGEWPWFVNVNQQRVAEWYPVYSVHQASMAMLFLLPALDMGVAGARASIEKSLSWLAGGNELGIAMMRVEPFMTFRCIRRREPASRALTYGRSLARSALHSQAPALRPAQLDVNTECRSYEIGWLLYAWAGRKDFEDFTELRACPGSSAGHSATP